jgi:peptidoglycan/LPS O-acetylase OafA/YrhL
VIFGLLALRVGKRAALYLVLAAGAAFIFLHLRAMPFFIGMAVAYVAGKKDSPLARFKFSGLAIFGSMLCWHLGNLALGSQYATLPELLVSPLATVLYVGGGVLAFFGLLGVYSGHGLFCRLMVTPVFQWLGGLSFSLYMWQAITMAIIKKGMYVSGLVETVGPLSQLLFLLLALPPTLVISRLSQVYLESHATRWMRGYANRKMTVAGPVPTVSE